MERRGGFRADPVRQAAGPLSALPKRINASAVRGDAPQSDGTIDTDSWHEIGASAEPGFENSWVNYGGTWATAAFRRDGLGNVWIKGFVKNGTVGQTVFTLPAGYRPAQGLHLATISNDAIGKLQVLANGTVVATIGNNIWFSLQCSFPAEA